MSHTDPQHDPPSQEPTSASGYRGMAPLSFHKPEGAAEVPDDGLMYIYEYVHEDSGEHHDETEDEFVYTSDSDSDPDSDSSYESEEEDIDDAFPVEGMGSLHIGAGKAAMSTTAPEPVSSTSTSTTTSTTKVPSPKTAALPSSSTSTSLHDEPRKLIKRLSKGLLPTEKLMRNKFNSTSTLFVTNTITSPDTEEIIRCMAKVLMGHITRGYNSTKKVYYQIFSEAHHPLTKEPLDLVSMPLERHVHRYISTIFNVMKLDLECMIMCMAYIERVIEHSGLTLDQTNWRRVVLSCLITAAKVWEDLSVYNIDFLSFFNNITVGDLNRMELVLLNLVKFEVCIPASLYAKYYFELRSISAVDESNFPLKPLDREGIQRLESRSKNTEDQAKRRFAHKKTLSLTQLTPVAVRRPAVLS
eukprot:TRINITY_DN2433_c0_g1_i1.p1 TRINITY_DN2433_c0_g1~~TRINITY_DN2433_c0_g1_i1.p1  ORF type:complete len:432 (+),score=104.26 TRINITY_DN2433_c0_g1_i1:57-1298(+)